MDQMPRLCFPPLLALLLLLLLCLSTATASHESDHEVPSSATALTDENFDAHVFAPRSVPRAWFIFFYAPWCAHCKNILPIFLNVSRLLDAGTIPHARFGVVNAVRHKELAHRFGVQEYPTLVYTTGKANHWSRFHGGYDAQSFVQFAVYLQHGVEAGSFAVVVSDPRHFAEAERQMANGRVPVYVYVPHMKHSNTAEAHAAENHENDVGHAYGTNVMERRRAESREARWNIAVDSAASLGNIRFGVLFADDIPSHWAETAGASYIAVVQAAQQCAMSGGQQGPRGEVLVVYSDAHRRPLCYNGPWLDESDALHAELADFITRNGFRAVEEASSGLFSLLSTRDHWYLGLFVTDGPMGQNDTAIVPILREVVRERNARQEGEVAKGADGPRITLALADGRTHKIWCMRYHIDEKELPALVVVDPRRDKVFRMRTHTPGFETAKMELPWRINGEQQKMIKEFFDDVEEGRAEGEKLTIFGPIVEFLVKFPGLEFVYRTLGYEDALLVTLMFGFAFFVFILILSLCVEPAMERRVEAEAKRKKTD